MEKKFYKVEVTNTVKSYFLVLAEDDVDARTAVMDLGDDEANIIDSSDYDIEVEELSEEDIDGDFDIVWEYDANEITPWSEKAKQI